MHSIKYKFHAINVPPPRSPGVSHTPTPSLTLRPSSVALRYASGHTEESLDAIPFIDEDCNHVNETAEAG